MGVNVHLAVHVLASVVSLKQALLIAERTKQNKNHFFIIKCHLNGKAKFSASLFTLVFSVHMILQKSF